MVEGIFCSSKECAHGSSADGKGSEQSRDWSLKVCGQLRAGDVCGALKQVEALRAGSSRKRREQKHSLVTYLTNNRGRMDYRRYEAMGL
jgi:hypothetical protein